MNEDVKSTCVHIHSRADELIACLEGEIAKRDAELAACRVAVENCEVFRARIAELEHCCGVYGLELHNATERLQQAERQIKAIKAQEPVAYISGCYRDVIGGKSDRTPLGAELAFVNMGWIGQIPLYAAPVSEAKAQGVVIPEREDCQVSVPDGFERYRLANKFCEQRLVTDDHVRAIVVDAFASGYGFGIAAAPAAPAADAGLSLVEWAKDAVEWGGALNYAAWEFVNECPEKSALLFNNTKGPLRAAIMKYAEIVAANAKDSSHD